MNYLSLIRCMASGLFKVFRADMGLTCREVLCTGVVVVARVVGEATVVTMQGSCFSVVSSRDSALMNWGCSNT